MKYRYLIALFQLIVFGASAQELVRPIRLKTGVLAGSKNLRNELNLAGALKPVQYKDRYYILIQFTQMPDTATRRALAREGISLFDYIPDNTFLAEVSGQPGLIKRSLISGVYTLDPLAKISARLQKQLEQSMPDPAKLVAVSYYGHIERSTAIAELTAAGAQIADTKIQPARVIFIRANAAIVKKIAALPFVAFMGSQQMKDVPINFYSRSLHSIEALSAAGGRNLRGAGVTMGIGDNGEISSHKDFTGRLINRNPMAPAHHGIHTAGTMAGAGIMNPRNAGMAPKATIVSQYFSDILVNTPYYMNDLDMVITNNSYHSADNGCIGSGDYDFLSYYIDAQMNSYPWLLHVFASGNDGGNQCSPFSTPFATVKSGFQSAKNVLTVGAIHQLHYTIANFSSSGPVADGRLKPEIVAGGSNVMSTTLNNGYVGEWGTSMASPAVAGAMGLLYERYRQLHGGADPAAALIKAVACNNAEDLGNPGPDFIYGFGYLNARKSVEALENNTYFMNAVGHSGSTTHTITGVPAGTTQLKVMLYWNDPAANPNAVNALVNNLNLTVTMPGSTVRYPLVLNPAAASVNDVAVEGVDNRNNIEQVVINTPPAGNYTITINGANVPVGPQPYVVAYQVVPPTITLEYPFGEETLVPNEWETIRWTAPPGNANSFNIEYSVDNGATWNTIANNVASTTRVMPWQVPPSSTTTARVRISINNTALADESDGNFTILGQPSVTVTNPCPGYVSLNWTAVPAATSYEVLMLKGDSMSTIGTTNGTSYLLGGLNQGTDYWLGVRPLAGTKAGRRSLTTGIVPSAGACTGFDNDLTAAILVAPVTGRMFTSSQLGTVAPQLRIKNLGGVATSGSFNISYQVNGGSVVTESSTESIAANSDYTYTFTTPYNFSATGTYTVKAWVDFSSDGRHANDSLVSVIKQLQNDPIVLTVPFTEGFESATSQSYTSPVMGFDGLDRCDFFSDNSNGRARTFMSSGIARNGNRAITLDQKAYTGTASADSLVLTFNLGNYGPTDQMWLSFYYLNHGIDFVMPGNRVWIRGNDQSPWIPVYTLNTNTDDFGSYIKARPVNINEVLAGASQSVSSSFQVKFGEHGYTSANSIILNGNLDDGYTYDDITITMASNDAGMLQLLAPAVNNLCALGSAENITVQVKNYSASTMFNVPVSYDLNGTTVTENIASINAGQTLNYTFMATADLVNYQPYILNTWISYPGDNYGTNDTVKYTFRTVPHITSYPYLQDFEGSDGDWYTGGINSSWEWGSPAGTIINKAANGTNAWVTRLNGSYNNNETSFLYSPCFNLTGMTTPVLSFSHIFRTEDECDCDGHRMEYSTDGVNWVLLGEAGLGTNWYDHPIYQLWKFSNTKWHVSSINIPTKNAKVRFRFSMLSDPATTYEGVGIDDIHIFDKAGASIYNGPDITSGLSQNVSGSGWVHFNQGGRRVASINANGQNLGNTEVKLFINPGPVRDDGYQYYLDRNIVIQTANAPVNPVSVRFYYLNSEANDLIFASGCTGCSSISDAYEAGITQYTHALAEENGTLTDNTNGVYNFIPPSQVRVTPYDNGYYAEYQVTSFSEFWINSGGPGQNQPLPQVLSQFTAVKKDNTGLLKWKTLQETNTDAFVIERSADGLNYTAIGNVAAAGNSNAPIDYNFTDKQLLSGMNYYRLKMTDKDGSFVYSPIRKINNVNGDFTISLHPNPVTKGVVYINTSINCTGLELRDVAGRLLKTVVTQGVQNRLPVHDIAKGVYFITVHTEGGKKIEKLIVE